MPLFLFDYNGYYCLIPNFIMSIYTSGCLDVAITISDPYSRITIPSVSMTADQFQHSFHRLLNDLKQVPLRKNTDFANILAELENLPIPLPEEEDIHSDFFFTKAKDKPHPCEIFVLERI